MKHELPSQLTERQEAALKVIASKQKVAPMGPSLREVAETMGVAVYAVQGLVGKLRAAGALEAESGRGLICVQPNTMGIQPHTSPIPVIGSRKIDSRGTRYMKREPLAKPGGKLL